MFAIRSIQICSRNAAIGVKNVLTSATTVRSTSTFKLNTFRSATNGFSTITARPTNCLSSGNLHPLMAKEISQYRWYSSAATNNSDTSKMKRVYYGSLTPRIRAVKIFSLTTSLVGLAAQPLFLEQGMKLGGTAMAVVVCGFAGFFTFVTPLLLHFITKKYITEIHYDSIKDEYIATTISLLLYKIETKFRMNDVKVPEIPGMFTSFLIQGKPFFVDPSQFDDPEHYVRLMGYDKPIDFKLGLDQDEDNLKK